MRSRGVIVIPLVCVTWSGRANAEPPTATFPLVDEAPKPSVAVTQDDASRMPPEQPAGVAVPAPPTAGPNPAPERVVGTSDWSTTVLGDPAVAPPSGFVGADEPAAKRAPDVRDQWMVSVEGVTRAPIDVGFLAGIEVPGRVHVHAGYGWVPSAYVGWITERIGAASGANNAAFEIIRNGFDSGHAWRLQAGVRPLRDLGLYVDAGYSRIMLDGSLDTALASGFASPAPGDGAYTVETALDTWFIELGYLAHVSRNFLLGAGLGLMGTLGADTRVTASDARLPQVDQGTLQQVNDDLERYGYLPTLTLRAGFDLY